MRPDVQNDPPLLRQPIEVAPDLATNHAVRSPAFGHAPDGLDQLDSDGDVRVVRVDGIVRVHDLRCHLAQQRVQITADSFPPSFHVGTWMSQAHDSSIAPTRGSTLLLVPAEPAIVVVAPTSETSLSGGP